MSGRTPMKITMILAGFLITGAMAALCFHVVHRRDTNIEAGLRAVHAEDLRKRHRAELESDGVERETEKLVWDAPLGLAQQRVIIAVELADEQQQEKESSGRGDAPNTDIALQVAALARIDARIQELSDQAATRSLQYKAAQR
jgi:hypothetical protein